MQSGSVPLGRRTNGLPAYPWMTKERHRCGKGPASPGCQRKGRGVSAKRQTFPTPCERFCVACSVAEISRGA